MRYTKRRTHTFSILPCVNEYHVIYKKYCHKDKKKRKEKRGRILQQEGELDRMFAIHASLFHIIVLEKRTTILWLYYSCECH